MKPTAILLCLLALSPALAQQSTSFRITESTLNAGGHPVNGLAASSPSYSITLDAIGDAVAADSTSGLSYVIDSGFVESFAPPGEVVNLRFTDAITLVWAPERSVGDYALYQGQVTGPFDPAYGTCQQPPSPLGTETTTIAATPAIGDALFILVTARNRLGEEGTKGTGRANPVPCP